MIDLEGLTLSRHLARIISRQQYSGLTARFIQAASRSSHALTAREFFGQYEENMIEHCRQRGIEILNDTSLDHLTMDQAVIDDVNDISDRQKQRARGRGPKPYETNVHDMVLWHFVSRKRPRVIDSPLQAVYWVATLDYGLVAFDRRKRASNDPPMCVPPATLMQLLRLWVPRGEAAERAVVAALRLPFFFLGFDPAAERVTLRIVKQIARYEASDEFTERTVNEILLNKTARQRLANDPRPEADEAIVRDAVAEEAKRLAGEQHQLERKLVDAQERYIALQDKLEHVDAERLAEVDLLRQQVEASHRAAADLESRAAAADQRAEDLAAQIHGLNRRIEQGHTQWRRVAYCITSMFGLTVAIGGANARYPPDGGQSAGGAPLDIRRPLAVVRARRLVMAGRGDPVERAASENH
jgi:hypothetical protein